MNLKKIKLKLIFFLFLSKLYILLFIYSKIKPKLVTFIPIFKTRIIYYELAATKRDITLARFIITWLN